MRTLRLWVGFLVTGWALATVAGWCASALLAILAQRTQH